ncbi:MAG: TonB-dependent receptor plug domain-containing protein [Bacteroidota bacterium]
MQRLLIIFIAGALLGITHLKASAQSNELIIAGTVRDSLDQGINDVTIITQGRVGTISNVDGSFRLVGKKRRVTSITLRHINYEPQTIPIEPASNDSIFIAVQLKAKVTVLEGVEVSETIENTEVQAGAISLNSKNVDNVPSPFQDISRVLATLPGVTANNELSSTYNVRGGNYEENLIYVNDIPIYRPFLIRAGQQEGLGFVNTDMVSNVDFHAGGWQPKYGDKLSSSLNVTYKRPTQKRGGLDIGLLGGSAFYEGITSNDRVSYIVGVRHKDSRYLLNSLEVDGEYFPTFTDVQGFTTIDLSKDKDKSSQLTVLMSYARNRYETLPESRQTDFGTLSANFRLFVAFEGIEQMRYDTYQTGLKWSKRFSNWVTDLIVSGVRTQERERFEVEGGYRLCDLNTNPSSSNFNECAITRGIGTNYQSGRNSLAGNILNTESRNRVFIDDRNLIEFGVGWSAYDIDDEIREFTFIDSADFVAVDDRIFNEVTINSNQFTGYLQHTFISTNNKHTLTYGARLNYWDYNGQLLFSPRMQYAYLPDWARPLSIRLAIGSYQQPPFYRELRDREGQINPQVQAQSSTHFILGTEYNFSLWGRPFVFFSEAYYKHLYNLNLYDIENVRLRYFANNDADGYAAGIEFRVHGEFIPGTESWFSLGILKTEEDILTDDLGSFRRPSDQRINLAMYFQDHMPNDPSIRIALTLFYGSGLPFGPPDNDELRNAFSGDEYYRADLGFLKVFDFKEKYGEKKWGMDNLRLGIEVLNLFGAQNTISYTWVQDVINNQFAVPNALSARFLNLRIQTNF